MSPSVKFPDSITLNGRKFFIRHEIENHKRALAGLPLIKEASVSVVEFVPAPQVAEELGQSRRTSGRRMKAVKCASDTGEGEAA